MPSLRLIEKARERPLVNIYIARDGKRTGPHPLADVQRMVDRDTVKITDLAWCEGQTDWIQLKQIPGFFSRANTVRVPKPEPLISQIRPGFVWVICALIFVGTPIDVLTNMYDGVVLISGPQSHISPYLREDKVSLCIVTIIFDVIQLTGALFLFYLRRPAVYFFGGFFICSMLGFVYTLSQVTDSELLHSFMPRIILAITYQLVVFGYVFHLYRRRVLR